MGRKSMQQIEAELREKIEKEYKPWPISITPEFELKWNGLEARAIPTGYVEIYMQKARD